MNLATALRPAAWRHFLNFTLVRIGIAVFTTALAGGLTEQFVADATRGRLHPGAPSLLGAAAALAAYALYVRLVERRPVVELAARPAIGELGAGLAGGAALVGLVVGILAAIGALHLSFVDSGAPGLAPAFAQTVFVAVLEELLMRAIVFRLVERAHGTRIALGVSAAIFALGHLPGDDAGALSTVVAVVAGVFFAAAYLTTRRLWLPIALHTGWNFTLGSVFALEVSGHARTAGLWEGRLEGPRWLTGGAYGAEASVVTLVALLVATAALLHRARAGGRFVALPRRTSQPGSPAPLRSVVE